MPDSRDCSQIKTCGKTRNPQHEIGSSSKNPAPLSHLLELVPKRELGNQQMSKWELHPFPIGQSQ